MRRAAGDRKKGKFTAVKRYPWVTVRDPTCSTSFPRGHPILPREIPASSITGEKSVKLAVKSKMWITIITYILRYRSFTTHERV